VPSTRSGRTPSATALRQTRADPSWRGPSQSGSSAKRVAAAQAASTIRCSGVSFSSGSGSGSIIVLQLRCYAACAAAMVAGVEGVFGTLTYPHLVLPYSAYYDHVASHYSSIE
jgi:hypothetical protein